MPLRAETIVVGRHFSVSQQAGDALLTVKGTMEDDQPLVMSYLVDQPAGGGRVSKFDRAVAVPSIYQADFDKLTTRAVEIGAAQSFHDRRRDGWRSV